MHVGFGNTVPWPRVVAILAPGSNPVKRLRREADGEKRLINACCGRQCRAVVVTDSNHVILSPTAAETLKARLAEARGT